MPKLYNVNYGTKVIAIDADIPQHAFDIYLLKQSYQTYDQYKRTLGVLYVLNKMAPL